jgi:hypothetical protein
VYVVRGAAKQRITDKALAAAQGISSLKASDPEFDYYPTEWFEPYLSRRRATGFGLYDALGIAREDKEARGEQMLRNFRFFDAPVGLFITFSRRMSVGTFMDVGMFIENILIGARGEGLHTCGQVAWCSHHKMIREELASMKTSCWPVAYPSATRTRLHRRMSGAPTGRTSTSG